MTGAEPIGPRVDLLTRDFDFHSLVPLRHDVQRCGRFRHPPGSVRLPWHGVLKPVGVRLGKRRDPVTGV